LPKEPGASNRHKHTAAFTTISGFIEKEVILKSRLRLQPNFHSNSIQNRIFTWWR